MAIKLHAKLDGASVLTLDEVKLHLRLRPEVDVEEDSLLERLMTTAEEDAEAWLWRALSLGTYDYYPALWPPQNHYLRLPMPPLRSVEYFKYTDNEGNSHDFDAFDVDTVSEPGRLVLRSDAAWPRDLGRNNPIHVRFTAGYDDVNKAPSAVKSAMLLMVSDLYENRGEIVVGAAVNRISAIANLLMPYRIFVETL